MYLRRIVHRRRLLPSLSGYYEQLRQAMLVEMAYADQDIRRGYSGLRPRILIILATRPSRRPELKLRAT